MRICTVIVDDLAIRALATDSFRKDSVVVFLHGWGDSADRFMPFLALAESSDSAAVAFDWPWFGRSPLPKKIWWTEEYANFLGKFLDKYAKNSKKVTLVAHSMGARFAVRFAIKHPERVTGIVLTGAAGIAPEHSGVRNFFAGIGKRVFSLPILSRYQGWVRDRFSSGDYRASGELRDIFRAVIAVDQRDEYAKLGCPVKLLWGESDDQTPLSDYRYMLANIPDVSGKTYVGGHFFFSDIPAEFWREIESFINT